MLTGTPGHLQSFDYVGFVSVFVNVLHKSARQDVHDSRSRRDRVDADSASSGRRSVCSRRVLLHAGPPPSPRGGKAETSHGLKFISRVKQLSGYHYKQKFGQQLWQRYGFERVLRNDEQTLVVARYISRTPLVVDWQHASRTTGSSLRRSIRYRRFSKRSNRRPAKAGHYVLRQLSSG